MKFEQLQRYEVHCACCGLRQEPDAHSPLWWKAHLRAKAGFVDEMIIGSKECGCCPVVIPQTVPSATEVLMSFINSLRGLKIFHVVR